MVLIDAVLRQRARMAAPCKTLGELGQCDVAWNLVSFKKNTVQSGHPKISGYYRALSRSKFRLRRGSDSACLLKGRGAS